jgi:hypothetical protein
VTSFSSTQKSCDMAYFQTFTMEVATLVSIPEMHHGSFCKQSRIMSAYRRRD